MVETIKRHCQKSLVSLEYTTDPEWLNIYLTREGPNDKKTYHDTDASSHCWTLAKAGLNDEVNLTGFTQLKHLRLDAELLLNGYGALTAAMRHGSRNRVKYPWSSTAYMLDHGFWTETDPYDAPPLYELLPSSLSILILRCGLCQEEPLLSRLTQMVDRRAAFFPDLDEVVVLTNDNPDPTVRLRWTRAMGFTAVED